MHKKDYACKERLGMAAHNFFMVTPFAAQIRNWVAKQLQMKGRVKRYGENKFFIVGLLQSFKNFLSLNLEGKKKRKSRLFRLLILSTRVRKSLRLTVAKMKFAEKFKIEKIKLASMTHLRK